MKTEAIMDALVENTAELLIPLQAKTVLLEPYYEYVLEVPEESLS